MANIDQVIAGLQQLNLKTEAGQNSAREQLQTLFNNASRSQVTYKAPRPQVFTGGRNALATRDWLETIECYCKRSNLPFSDWTEAAVDHLRGTARTWFRLSGLEATTDWDTFKTEFTKEFKPSDHEQAIIRELRDLRQTSLKDIDAYINRFRDLALQLDEPSDKMLREYFVQGLVTETQLQVQLANPSTWQEAISVAERINSVFTSVRHGHKTKAEFLPSRTSNPSSKTEPDLPPGEPMDVDHFSTFLASLVNSFQRKKTPYPSRRPLPKLTPSDRAHLRRIGACFRCREIGHMADKCRGTGQSVNAVETPTESGNDPGEA